MFNLAERYRARAAIQEIKQTKDGTSIKLYDKIRALDSLSKYKGLFIEKKEIAGKDGGPLEVEISPEVQAILDEVYDYGRSN